ncbi:hypothetical protein ACWGK6_07900 [Streptomyces violaceusniger]
MTASRHWPGLEFPLNSREPGCDQQPPDRRTLLRPSPEPCAVFVGAVFSGGAAAPPVTVRVRRADHHAPGDRTTAGAAPRTTTTADATATPETP